MYAKSIFQFLGTFFFLSSQNGTGLIFLICAQTVYQITDKNAHKQLSPTYILVTCVKFLFLLGSDKV